MWRFLKKLEIELPYDPAIPILGIHIEETRIERDMCTPMFTATLFIIARTWKQPRCPSADEWIRKQWYIYTMEYYSAIKKNTFESVLMRWMKLEPNIQSEVSQKEKHQYSMLLLSRFSHVNSVRPHRRQPIRLLRPWDSPGKNTRVGCHFPLQCMKVKRESEVTQSCPTLPTPWTLAYQALPSMGFSRQEYWIGVPLPSPGNGSTTPENDS